MADVRLRVKKVSSALSSSPAFCSRHRLQMETMRSLAATDILYSAGLSIAYVNWFPYFWLLSISANGRSFTARLNQRFRKGVLAA